MTLSLSIENIVKTALATSALQTRESGVCLTLSDRAALEKLSEAAFAYTVLQLYPYAVDSEVADGMMILELELPDQIPASTLRLHLEQAVFAHVMALATADHDEQRRLLALRDESIAALRRLVPFEDPGTRLPFC